MAESTPLAIKAKLPCPFCGGCAELHEQLRGDQAPGDADARAYFYVCGSCAAVGGWGKSEGTALRMWNLRAPGNAVEWRFCRGEGCARADLCRRHMDAAKESAPTYFEKSPVLPDGQCGEFVGNGFVRKDPQRCGGAHPPPRCAHQCSITEDSN